MKEETRFRYENKQDSENVINAYATVSDGLMVSVSDEKAVDSYNEVFACEIYLPNAAAKKLRDYLNANFQE